MRQWIVRHERDGENVVALWENEDGNRWYVQVVISGAGRGLVRQGSVRQA